MFTGTRYQGHKKRAVDKVLGLVFPNVRDFLAATNGFPEFHVSSNQQI
jgi:hypothetical protein